MPRRKPELRTRDQRSSDNDKRRLRQDLPPPEWLEQLRDRATYAGSSKHKLQPRAFGVEPSRGEKGDETYCDAHAGFTPEDMNRVPLLLRRGIMAGLIGDKERLGDPTLLWSVDDNGWIYECRITSPGAAVYHGYPVLAYEAIARKVIARYVNWVYDGNHEELRRSIEEAQERYS